MYAKAMIVVDHCIDYDGFNAKEERAEITLAEPIPRGEAKKTAQRLAGEAMNRLIPSRNRAKDFIVDGSTPIKRKDGVYDVWFVTHHTYEDDTEFILMVKVNDVVSGDDADWQIIRLENTEVGDSGLEYANCKVTITFS